ncbi:ArsS family sensor histidine kinase [Sulfurimonas sp.]|uniref:ArsS family sensor histidine kinase n=1 Tax=Sulfurimonas sp. TaxID=2022749 RepID=UPI0025F25165|nr:ArsS family sensor histidine kinase [Sulfurimonas sp.]MCK9472668.1 ArsS family sensor histidine kinase [Sulfurimonas sp.]MDD3505100.1 ArsS family sensor histidine kinase [Sulfurimonas sp.]
MKKHSILFTINIIFLISLVLISASFVMLYGFNKQREKRFNHKRDMEISKIFMHQYRGDGVSDELIAYMKSLDFLVVLDAKEIENILASKEIKSRELKANKFFKLRYLELNERHFVLIQTPNEKIILTSQRISSDDKNIILIVYILILLIFIFLYLSIVNKLKPLKILKQSAKEFGDENFDVNFLTSNEDEISQLANEFHKAAQKLKKLKESRNVFIRNIMHELKTPITKGNFLTQLPQTEENIESMQKVFYRLESLINEFASIEELISTKKELEKKSYFLEDIVDNAIDILMCEEDKVVKAFDNIKIDVDFTLFSIAVKNLLDNGIKYSKDKKVIVKTDASKIVFENVGLKLSYELQNYFEPFFKGNKSNLPQSFGLGLYIVKHILDAHSLELKYENKEGVNRFIIELPS